jgi:hypothetical protein
MGGDLPRVSLPSLPEPLPCGRPLPSHLSSTPTLRPPPSRSPSPIMFSLWLLLSKAPRSFLVPRSSVLGHGSVREAPVAGSRGPARGEAGDEPLWVSPIVVTTSNCRTTPHPKSPPWTPASSCSRTEARRTRGPTQLGFPSSSPGATLVIVPLFQTASMVACFPV